MVEISVCRAGKGANNLGIGDFSWGQVELDNVVLTTAARLVRCPCGGLAFVGAVGHFLASAACLQGRRRGALGTRRIATLLGSHRGRLMLREDEMEVKGR